MSQKTYFLVCAAVFFVVATAHLARLIVGWEIAIAGWTAPQWVSVQGGKTRYPDFPSDSSLNRRRGVQVSVIVKACGGSRWMRGFVAKPVELAEQYRQCVPAWEFAGNPPGS